MQKVLIIGGDGKIGSSIFNHFSKLPVKLAKTSRRKDFIAQETLFFDGGLDQLATLKSFSPDIVVWALGVSGYSQCKEDIDTSFFTNVTILDQFIDNFPNLSNFIFFSSTAVFDKHSGNYNVESCTLPTSEYGKQKQKAEFTVQQKVKNYSILRLGKVLTPDWPLIEDWTTAIKNRKEIHAFSDLFFSPVLISSIDQFVEKIHTTQGTQIYHCTNSKTISYVEMAEKVVSEISGDLNLIKPKKCNFAEMTDGGAGNVVLKPSTTFKSIHLDPIAIPFQDWFSN